MQQQKSKTVHVEEETGIPNPLFCVLLVASQRNGPIYTALQPVGANDSTSGENLAARTTIHLMSHHTWLTRDSNST